LGYDSRVFFDGLQAAQGTFSGSDAFGTLTLGPPPGASGQTATVTVYNSDGQNSTILSTAALPTFSYPVSGSPQIVSIAPNALPAGGAGMVDIAAANMNFVDGQVTLGFGSHDVQVRRVWVLSPTHAIANVAVAANAPQGFSEVSVISGMQIASLANAFQIQPARAGGPIITSAVNGDATQQAIVAGGSVTIFGQNLTGAQVSVNDTPWAVAFSNASQINFFVPAGFPAGPAILKVTTAGGAALPIVFQIDAPPPAIAQVNTAFTSAGEVLQLMVLGVDPSVASNPGRLRVTVSGMDMTVQQITPFTPGVWQIQVVVNQSFGASQVPLVVWTDGTASAPVSITVR
jgi:uncharacterized protein (TIGR03437 family)